jgi:hypothetical protein
MQRSFWGSLKFEMGGMMQVRSLEGLSDDRGRQRVRRYKVLLSQVKSIQTS